MHGILRVSLLEYASSVTPGQSAIFYPLEDDYLLLGGIIQKGSIKQIISKREGLLAE
jgi:tRNA-specific 2-thiouridylase